MRACAIVTCKNRGVHTFPTNENLKQQWIRATKVDVQRKIGWHLRKHSCVCSDHFTQSDFDTYGNFKRLKRTAVPSVFPWGTLPLASSSKIVTPEDVSSQDLLEHKFNPANAVKTYSRPDHPTTFVEEYSTLNIEIPLDDADPLQISNNHENTEYWENYSSDESGPTPEENGPDNTVKEMKVIATDINDIQDETTKYENGSNWNKTSQYCDTFTQTINYTESFSKTVSDMIFSVHKCKTSDRAIKFYTGLETFVKLTYVFNTLRDYPKVNYFCKTSTKLDALEQFFITLMILRRHTEYEEIAVLYTLSVKEVAEIFKTWIRFMASQWRNLDFYDKHPMTRVVLDTIECPIKKPGSPLAQQVTFSSHKNMNTVKFFVGIDSSGLIAYISPLYGGSVPDQQILEKSNILPRPNYNELMVDDGQNVQEMVMSYEVKVNIPTLFKKEKEIDPEMLINNKNKTVCVKRIFGMMKSYKILKQRMNQMETMHLNDIAFVCAVLTNFGSSDQILERPS